MSRENELELLAPAADKDVAIEAIKHGADAVYIGGSAFGARKSASNSVEDIRRVVEFAHKFRSKVYVTVNTIIYENELREAEKLCRSLYRIGVDALIVQDMGILRLDLPPIALHASTQCDIRTPEKARFLQDVGFSQLVLARELTLEEIKTISSSVDIPVECFIHGALCVSYSGRCHASCAQTGRSANRGECAQLCRLPYSLKDKNGIYLARNKHLLSLKDFNASHDLSSLIDAGVSSFKIEGRLKEQDYVKNNVAYYNGLLNDIISQRNGEYRRSSFGSVKANFQSNPSKSFNRGFTNYFLTQRRPLSIASLASPKSMGEIITDIDMLHNGDGISFFDKEGNYQGVNINKVENGKIYPARRVVIPKDAVIHRTNDIEWQKRINRGDTAERKILIDVCLDSAGVSAIDDRGVKVRLPLEIKIEESRNKTNYSDIFRKLGDTVYSLKEFTNKIGDEAFIPRSILTALRRRLTDALDAANDATYPYQYRRKELKEARYPHDKLDYRDNVANSMARQFFLEHGVREIQPALETNRSCLRKGTVLMTTRHCILRELGMCKKNNSKRNFDEPLIIENEKMKFSLRFNCKDCEMEVLSE